MLCSSHGKLRVPYASESSSFLVQRRRHSYKWRFPLQTEMSLTKRKKERKNQTKQTKKEISLTKKKERKKEKKEQNKQKDKKRNVPYKRVFLLSFQSFSSVCCFQKQSAHKNFLRRRGISGGAIFQYSLVAKESRSQI